MSGEASKNTNMNKSPSAHYDTVSSGYYSSESLPPDKDVTMYNRVPNHVIDQPLNIDTNGIHGARYNNVQQPSLPVMHPRTMPLMVATQEQLDYIIAQQISNSQQRYRYSGPLHMDNNMNMYHQSRLYNNQATNVNQPDSMSEPKSMFVSSHSVSVPNSMSTKKDNLHARPRRSTLSEIPEIKHDAKMEAAYKRANYKLKEFDIAEEDTTSTLLVGEDFGGYDYQFLIKPAEQEEVTCPICQLVLCEPFLTSCCGAHFCHSCIEPLLHKRNPCPLCNNENLQGIVDRRTERKINSLPVRCTKYDMGCTWTGTITDLHTHLSPSSGDCAYVIISCPFGCGEEHPLSTIKQHQEEECGRRIHLCKFCNYRGIYEEMPERHWPVCEGYPVPCPHNCSVNDMARRLLPQHLSQCPKRTVQCPFTYAGCFTHLQGDELEDHMKENVAKHLELLSDTVKNLMSNQDHHDRGLSPSPDRTGSSRASDERNVEIIILNRKLNEKEEEISALRGQIVTLQEENEETKLDLARVKSFIVIPPVEFTVTNYTENRNAAKQWFSTPFYTHKQGYKMCVSVDCNGADEGEGTHVSVYANLMKGEFDDTLHWPFAGVITVQLYNQCFDDGHVVHDIPFGKSLSSDIAGRVTDQELAENGLGVPQFIRHTSLGYSRQSNTEFLKDDQLKFCVLKVKINC